jgi:pilus assembly protein FimV
VEAPPEDEPGAEECDEAEFFLDQQLYEEAREIIETVLIAFPGHARASLLMERLEREEAGGPVEAESAPEERSPPQVEPAAESKDAFDLAAELAGELDGLEGGEEEAPAASAFDDYQVSVEEVFSEFKKGLAKIVKPEDVDTHYDLGIAYKEMGLLDDAIGEFTVARQGCANSKREIDCLTMIGVLQVHKGDGPGAVETFKQALSSEHATADVGRALRYELAAAWEAAGSPAKALFHFQQVASLDARFRDVAAQLARLAAITAPEEDSVGNGAPGTHAGPAGQPLGTQSRPGAKAGKVGYV